MARKVQKRVDEHGAMPCRQDEAIAIRPLGIGRIILQMFCEERCGRIRHAHRHPGVTAIGGLDRVHRLGAHHIEKAEGTIRDGDWTDFDPLSWPQMVH